MRPLSGWRSAASVVLFGIGTTLVFGQDLTVLHSFSGRGGSPRSALLVASNGKSYGTTTTGGVAGLGSIYVLEPDGSGGYTYSELFAQTSSSDGSYFDNALVEGTDGWLYGTTFWGGDHNFGAVFRISTAGVYQKLASFDSTTGHYPNGLILATDGAFYGTTVFGLASNAGSAFRFTLAGGIVAIHAFADSNQSYASGRLYQAANGDFYGVTSYGGSVGWGTVFRMTASGTVTTLYSFSGPDGLYPMAGLAAGSDGFLYGTTPQGGSDNSGVIFRVGAQDAVTVVHEFSQAEGVLSPQASFVLASDGKLYGTSTFGGALFGGTIYRLESNASVTIVHALASAEGEEPQAGLVEVVPGHFLGTAMFRGAGNYGTVFACDTAGTLSVVHAFFGADEGFNIAGGVAQGADGAFYGTAWEGGASGLGTIYRLDAANALTLIHTFAGGDGANPWAALALGPDGRLYGTTIGPSPATAFAIDIDGNFDLIHAFSWAEGPAVYAGLLPASDGNLYGAGAGGGPFRLTLAGVLTPLTVDDPQCLGTLIESDGSFYGTSVGSVFRITGSTSETLHTFAPPNGSNLWAGLVRGADGNFYGTTQQGGAGGLGTIFRLDASGAVTTIHDFRAEDGGFPTASLIQATDGFLYGVAGGYGAGGYGTVFRTDYSGTGFSTLHAFTGPDGRGPEGSLIQAADGSLVGTAAGGGALNGGVVFRMALPPAILTVSGISPSSGSSAGAAPVAIAGGAFAAGATAKIGGVAAPNPSVTGPTQILAATPTMSPGTLNDVTVTNPDLTSATLPAGFLADFLDVPAPDIFHAAVESVFRHGITAGCGGGQYCRNQAVSRAQMAVFLVKAIAGPAYQPAPATGSMFLDVPADAFAADWIEDFATRGITAGCGGGNFCPNDSVSRAQMAVFLLKALLTPAYQPPAPSGTLFADVPVDGFAAAWIEDLAFRGITAGCGGGLYCPDGSSTRGQMAVFLQRTFSLP